MLSSVGVMAAAVILLATGLFLLPRTARLCGQALRVLMEAAPPGIDVAKIRESLERVPGVESVHDLHVWTVTSGMEMATGHLVLKREADAHAVLDEVTAVLSRRYRIDHATIQCEPFGHHERRGTV